MQRYKNRFLIYNTIADILFKLKRFIGWAKLNQVDLWTINLYSLEKDITFFKRSIWKPFLQKLQSRYPIRCFGVTEYQANGNVHVHLLFVFQELHSKNKIVRDINKFIREIWIETNKNANNLAPSRMRMKIQPPNDKDADSLMRYMSKLFKGTRATKTSSLTSKNNRLESWSVSCGLESLNLWSYNEIPSRSLSPKRRKDFVASYLSPYQIENPKIKSLADRKLNEHTKRN